MSVTRRRGSPIVAQDSGKGCPLPTSPDRLADPPGKAPQKGTRGLLHLTRSYGGPQVGSGCGPVSRQSGWEVNLKLWPVLVTGWLPASAVCSEWKTKHMEPGGGWTGLSPSPSADLALGQQGPYREWEACFWFGGRDSALRGSSGSLRWWEAGRSQTPCPLDRWVNCASISPVSYWQR